MSQDWRRRVPDILGQCLDAALAAVDPAKALPAFLPNPPKGRTIVLGAGKAAASMAAAVEAHWPGELEGLVVTRHGHGLPLKKIELVEAAHPIPDEAGQEAARRIFALAQSAGADDMVLCLISGGGSALLALPEEGITLEDKRAVTKALLKSGAPIGEVNIVRKQLSAVKGGKLAAAAAPAHVVGLILSDVPGDDLSIIASGPTVADDSTAAQAREILRRYKIEAPGAVTRLLEKDRPRPNMPRDLENHLIATAADCLRAAAAKAEQAGLRTLVLGDFIEGEASEAAKVMAGIALAAQRRQWPAPPPLLILSGGETTVTVAGEGGRGGRNTEFLLSLALALKGAPGIHALSVDTDGIDGTEDAAGAIITPDSLRRAEKSGLDARALLEQHDSYGFFDGLGDLVVTGPTLTNVNDFRAILVE